MDDMISRQAVISALKERDDYLNEVDLKKYPNALHIQAGVMWCLNVIKAMPYTTCPELKTAVWKPMQYGGMMCSGCGQATGRRFKYCPNCGAKMSEV